MVLPGFTAGDESTLPLRRYLRSLGYYVHGWRLGRNFGFNGDRQRFESRLAQRMDELFARHGRKLSLVGWSLGGIYARQIARAAPQLVRQVMTFGSPLAGRGHGSNILSLYDMVTDRQMRDDAPEAVH